MDANGYRGEFPQSYLDAVGKMVEFTYNIAFPDYTLPVFSDNKLHENPVCSPITVRGASFSPTIAPCNTLQVTAKGTSARIYFACFHKWRILCNAKRLGYGCHCNGI